MSFVPSSYQQAIFDFVKNGSGDAVINAVAGSGKSTTLVHAAKTLSSDSVLFLAFNKLIVEDLEKKLAGTSVKAQTLNSLGHGALMKKLGRVKLDGDKYRNIARQLTLDMDLVDRSKYVKFLCDLTSHAMSSLSPINDDALTELMTRLGMEPSEVLPATAFHHIRQMLKTGEELAKHAKTVSFDDQIWLPVLWRIAPKKYDFIFVDECQDLSRAKLELVLLARAAGGRIIFVGDPNQAIYGFAGADAASFANIVKKTKATVFPLSVSYRCPQDIVELAKSIVPTIEAAENAPKGAVNSITESNLFVIATDGDLILCRLTAPLIKAALTFIAKRIPARVRGRDIGKQMTNQIRDVAKLYNVTHVDKFLDAHKSHTTQQVIKLSKRDGTEKMIESILDRADAIEVCWEASHADTIPGFCAEIEELFTDDRASIDLSTIHRAKGLESDNVFILKPDRLPLTWKNQQDWEYEQEMNLKYVACTRAKKALYICDKKES